MSEWRAYCCGSASSSRSLQSSYEWIEGDFRLQLDFGYGALFRRCQAAGDIVDALDSITHIYLSHGHPDHIVDLSRLAIALKYTPGYTPRNRVVVCGTKPTLDAVKGFLDSVGLEEAFDEPFEARYVETGETFGIAGHRLQTFGVLHKEGAAGLRIESPQGRSVAYTGDTGPFAALKENLQDLDLLAIEMSFLDTRVETHMTLEDVSELASDARPRGLTPIHLYPELERHSDVTLRSRIAKWYEGDVFIARDGMALTWDDRNAVWRSSVFL